MVGCVGVQRRLDDGKAENTIEKKMIVHPISESSKDAPRSTTSVFEDHIAFMERKQRVESGRRKKTKVL